MAASTSALAARAVIGADCPNELPAFALKTPKEWFMTVVTQAGVADFTWNEFRHTFASRLFMAGVATPPTFRFRG